MADRAVEEYGRLDTWVHLAAVGLFATFGQTTPEEFARVIDMNLMGQVYGVMAALPHLKREGGGALTTSPLWRPSAPSLSTAPTGPRSTA